MPLPIACRMGASRMTRGTDSGAVGHGAPSTSFCHWQHGSGRDPIACPVYDGRRHVGTGMCHPPHSPNPCATLGASSCGASRGLLPRRHRVPLIRSPSPPAWHVVPARPIFAPFPSFPPPIPRLVGTLPRSRLSVRGKNSVNATSIRPPACPQLGDLPHGGHPPCLRGMCGRNRYELMIGT